MNAKYMLNHLFWRSLDIIFPPSCGGCGKSGIVWCESCQAKVEFMKGELCDICGIPCSPLAQCDVCVKDRPHFTALRSWAVFETPVRTAMHQLKYRRNMALGKMLADQMYGYVKQLDWHFDVIVPIPLGKKRLKERGYNQSAMVAHPLALKLNVLYRPDLLIRSKETRSQVGLTRNERKNNISNAFIATSKAFGRTVLIIDDVATTGSTLSAAAEALLLAGAEKVYAFTVARALKHQMAHA